MWGYEHPRSASSARPPETPRFFVGARASQAGRARPVAPRAEDVPPHHPPSMWRGMWQWTSQGMSSVTAPSCGWRGRVVRHPGGPVRICRGRPRRRQAAGGRLRRDREPGRAGREPRARRPDPRHGIDARRPPQRARSPRRGTGAVRFKNVAGAVEVFLVEREHAPTSAGVLDPVCRVRVDPAFCIVRVGPDGQPAIFCSEQCAQTFACSPSG